MVESTTYYIKEDGNVLRKVAAPLPTRELRRRELEEERIRNAEAKRRAQMRVIRRRRLSFLNLLPAIALSLAVFMVYLYLSNSIMTRRNNIQNLQTQINEVTARNDIMENQISSQSNIDEIRNSATSATTMRYATGDQIVHYSLNESDNMKTYNDTK